MGQRCHVSQSGWALFFAAPKATSARREQALVANVEERRAGRAGGLQ